MRRNVALRVSLFMPVVIACLTHSISASPRVILRMVPEEYPEIVKIPFGFTNLATRGAISQSFQELPYGEVSCPNDLCADDEPPYQKTAKWLTPYFCEVAEMPFQVAVERVPFASEKVDSASSWVLLQYGADRSGLPLPGKIYGFEPASQGHVLVRFEAENLAFFDGKIWSLFRFTKRIGRFFVKTDLAYSSKQGVFFGTACIPFSGADYLAQGICHLSEEGIIKRVFWPPLLRAWQGRKDVGACYPLMDQCYWDITALRFLSEDVLWAGLVGGVVCLNLASDTWQLYDQYNSPVANYVIHIASIQDSSVVRVVCREHWLEEYCTAPRTGLAKIVRFADGHAEEEVLSSDANRALNEWVNTEQWPGGILSDKSGTIWFLGSGALWKSELAATQRMMDLPSPECQNLFMDSKGRVWVASTDRLWVQKGESWQTVGGDFLPQGMDKQAEITALGEDPTGRLWVCWEQWEDVGASVLGRAARQSFEESLAVPPKNE